MLTYLTLIFICQLLGELFVTATGLPIPGPVVGMALLFAGLLIKGAIPDDLGRVGDTLIENLSLLFIPAGVGVMLHVSLIGRDWLPISVALVVSTALTIVVTALVMVWLSPRPEAPEVAHKGEDI
ncbi:MAG: CidA/LrgA family protein [Alphaproteobacteria bacterium]